MQPGTVRLVLLLGLAALAAGCRQSSTSQEAGRTLDAGMASTADASADSPIHTIVMPHDEPIFPPGPGREEFIAACVVCHSPRYITMQPRFPRATWLSEVQKMKGIYGAHITDEQTVKIADYLFLINGKAGGGKAPKGIYGE
jgi:mono/diheme cytochrome c family protein